MKLVLLFATLFYLFGFSSGARAAEDVDISGTWMFSVDLEDGGHGDPTFVFKQENGKITGSYDGPLGQYKVTGTVKDRKAEFGFEFSRDGESLKATYTATIESSTKMTGTVDFSGATKGKWTATKK